MMMMTMMMIASDALCQLKCCQLLHNCTKNHVYENDCRRLTALFI